MPDMAQIALTKILMYCKEPEYFDDGGYAFPYLDPDKVKKIIRGQQTNAINLHRSDCDYGNHVYNPQGDWLYDPIHEYGDLI